MSIEEQNVMQQERNQARLRFFSYRMMKIIECANVLHNGGRLHQQYCVFHYCEAESIRLQYMKKMRTLFAKHQWFSTTQISMKIGDNWR